MLPLLKLGSTGPLVVQWQVFLRGQGWLVNDTGHFDTATREATLGFQKRHKLDADGVVGNQSYGKAAMLGFEVTDYRQHELVFPALPNFAPLTSNSERQAVFGPLQFVPAPTASNPEAIRITNDWEATQLTTVVIPQLMGITGGPSSGKVRLHRKVAGQVQALWQAWEDRGLLHHVLSYAGAWNARFIRGGADRQILSNHAFATAFDINVPWNPLGAQPATGGQKGCVYALVPVAHEFGLYWGGHFTRRDGMHFEVAKIL